MGRKNKKIRKVEVVAKKEGTDLYCRPHCGRWIPPLDKPNTGVYWPRYWYEGKKIVLNYLVDRGLLHSEEYEYIFAVIGCNKLVIKGVLDEYPVVY